MKRMMMLMFGLHRKKLKITAGAQEAHKCRVCTTPPPCSCHKTLSTVQTLPPHINDKGWIYPVSIFLLWEIKFMFDSMSKAKKAEAGLPLIVSDRGEAESRPDWRRLWCFSCLPHSEWVTPIDWHHLSRPISTSAPRISQYLAAGVWHITQTGSVSKNIEAQSGAFYILSVGCISLPDTISHMLEKNDHLSHHL